MSDSPATDPNLHQLAEAFRQHDIQRITRLLELDHSLKSDDPLVRLAKAYLCLVEEKSEEAGKILDDLSSREDFSDSTDLAYIKAFREEKNGNLEVVLETLRPFLDSTEGIHASRIRLRYADMLLKLGRYQEIEPSLGPYLSPPGTNQTLEAHLILLEAMLKTQAKKEVLVEQVSLIDVLLERGFVLEDPSNVIYYAQLCEAHGVEAIVERLIKSHTPLFERYSADLEEEVVYLLEVGNKFKLPSYIRAAGRSYEAKPFKFQDQDPEEIAYLFASHEEHRAARELLLISFSDDELHAKRSLWGPLLLETYHSGLWDEALNIIRKHRSDIQKMEDFSHPMIIRAVCEYQLGDFKKSLKSVKAAGEEFHRSALPEEAICEPLSHAALGQNEEFVESIQQYIQSSAEQQSKNEYLSALINELVIREANSILRVLLENWSRLKLDDPQGASLLGIGDLLLRWGNSEMIVWLSDQFDERGLHQHGHYLREIWDSLTKKQEADIFKKEIAETREEPVLQSRYNLGRLEALRFHGFHQEAIEFGGELLHSQTSIPQYLIRAHLTGAALDLDQSDQVNEFRHQLENDLRGMQDWSERRDTYLFEVNQIIQGQISDGLERNLRQALSVNEDSVEVLRLARLLQRLCYSRIEQKEFGLLQEADWVHCNPFVKWRSNK